MQACTLAHVYTPVQYSEKLAHGKNIIVSVVRECFQRRTNVLRLIIIYKGIMVGGGNGDH